MTVVSAGKCCDPRAARPRGQPPKVESPRALLHRCGRGPPTPGDDAAAVRGLFDARGGCDEFTQRVLSFDGSTGERRDPASDEVVYVLDGEADVAVGKTVHRVGPGGALYVPAGASWRVDAVHAAPLQALSVLVHDPLPQSG